ncbi:MAG TPA: EscU/YscU/HrcU family type III secretion system export apparatus switch protein [Polyangiaceae bacterium]|nr:EscU/YscU/HrcU family type III secretion system export apparatus switch protein [Polyangiaceae bacterium]
MADDSESERTEEPTPERRRKAREEGQFPRGRDAGNTIAGIAVLLVLSALGKDSLALLEKFAIHCLSEPYQLLSGDPRALFHGLATTIALLVFPCALAAALGALAIGIAEAGFHPNMNLVAPKWDRLDPLPKLQQMFKLQETGVDIVLQLARVAVVFAVAFASVKSVYPRLMHLERVSLEAAGLEIARALFKLGLWSSLALGSLALLDYLKSFRKHEASIRMSRQELKEEMKQQEGDHRIKHRQRARAREMLKRGLAKQIAQSDFVIANPTHISVALRYRVAEGAPVVTAKGYDEVALYIRKLAKENKIPVIENRPLARALAKRVRPGRPVPVDLYAAVAEILAFVYRLKGKTLGGSSSRAAPARRAAPAPRAGARGPRAAGPAPRPGRRAPRPAP